MERNNQIMIILNRKVKLENKRNLDVNIRDISEEMNCSVKEVEYLLKTLLLEGEIKALVQVGFSRDEYTLTIPENSSILNR